MKQRFSTVENLKSTNQKNLLESAEIQIKAFIL